MKTKKIKAWAVFDDQIVKCTCHSSNSEMLMIYETKKGLNERGNLIPVTLSYSLPKKTKINNK